MNLNVCCNADYKLLLSGENNGRMFLCRAYSCSMYIMFGLGRLPQHQDVDSCLLNIIIICVSYVVPVIQTKITTNSSICY